MLDEEPVPEAVLDGEPVPEAVLEAVLDAEGVPVLEGVCEGVCEGAAS